VTANGSLKSTELRRKVPPMVLMMADLRTFWTLFGMGLAVAMLHGPVVGRPDYNGLRYLIGPWLCPVAGTAYYFLWPFNPYRVTAADRIAGRFTFNVRDPEAQRLIQVFQSKAARHFLLRAMLQISSQLFGIMVLLAILHWRSLTWTLTSFWLAPGLVVRGCASSIVLGVELMNWGLSRWESDAGPDS
jgi:hypothetical protein